MNYKVVSREEVRKEQTHWVCPSKTMANLLAKDLNEGKPEPKYPASFMEGKWAVVKFSNVY